MRLYEFTTAQQQLDLLRQIMDCTWSAIAAQHKTQAAQKAATKYKPKVNAAAKVTTRFGNKAGAQHVQHQNKMQQVQQVQAPVFPRQQNSVPNSNSIKAVPTSAVATNATPQISPVSQKN